jgi:hypothetical protein
VKVVLDDGALVAIDKGDRKVFAMLRILQQRRIPVWTSAAVIAQVWRDGRKQAMLSRVLDGVGVRGLVSGEDRRTGELLSASQTRDVIDAHVALLVDDGDQVLTSDPHDLANLLAIRKVRAALVKT